ncbi:MAG: SAM-dependent chlorinase/fluorinase [Cyclobacteriaceae bacterium]|jgi:S-adenosyl-L-methionine hydrolase (adenosine-forming)|nr:SAM-dependent chlorinase/fluorinase [Cyclobacteriaceae bacterium]
MAIITLLTDSGESDHYVGAMKAKILSINPELNLVDISHSIAACDIAHGAYVLKSVFRDFPKGTIHLVGVDSSGNRDDIFLALQLEDHFFVGVDNGLFGLISDQNHQQAVQLNTVNTLETTFPEKDILAAAAARLASGVAITTLGNSIASYRKMMNRQVKATKRIIAGHVLRVDNYGNLITNIAKKDFDILTKDRAYTIQFGGEKFRRIHTNYFQTEQGDCFLIFNSLDLLEIGIYKGNASELLGLQYDSPVNVTFEEG